MIGVNVLGDAMNGCVAESKFVEYKGQFKVNLGNWVVDIGNFERKKNLSRNTGFRL